ncbi:hypothetical protein A3F34_00860 [Candidatus Roizmanbacteria bacterium RIFCSPHIGHO2_12_FULL_44_10]|uniref:Ketopantoate reductase N-terminal domain-containing protein n=1 Tax=Candidatus Roizmanbacteria bacterium RIFCSPHIGHO2_12_FULL_44_10 TaxID=1802054 RepID=A0A1F7I9I1_9BACT|nr:MAG: hypothetical protein A3F34_00860 [Candidatus Roizmanbacteria bacterium RIFCSPHIGHO2_12_FULL_44_10]
MTETERPTNSETLQPFSSIAVVGVGQTGGYFLREIAFYSKRLAGIQTYGIVRSVPDVRPVYIDHQVKLSDNPTEVLGSERPPQLVIVTVPIHEVAAALQPFTEYDGDVTILLTQNGVGTGELAQQVLRNRPNIRVVRGSLFTSVSYKPDGSLEYDHERRQIAFAPVPLPGQDDDKVYEEAHRLRRFFDSLGHQTHVLEDFKSMEWTKLLANSFGRSMIATGKLPSETFNDPDYYRREVESFLARAHAMHKAGIRIEYFPWLNLRSLERQLKLVHRSRMDAAPVMGARIRGKVSRAYTKSRGDIPPAAARKWYEDHELDPEILEYALPFIHLADQFNCPAPFVDHMVKEWYQWKETQRQLLESAK